MIGTGEKSKAKKKHMGKPTYKYLVFSDGNIVKSYNVWISICIIFHSFFHTTYFILYPLKGVALFTELYHVQNFNCNIFSCDGISCFVHISIWTFTEPWGWRVVNLIIQNLFIYHCVLRHQAFIGMNKFQRALDVPYCRSKCSVDFIPQQYYYYTVVV